MSFCQLSTRFTCNCQRCVGFSINSIVSSSSSSSLKQLLLENDESQYQQQQDFEEDQTSFFEGEEEFIFKKQTSSSSASSGVGAISALQTTEFTPETSTTTTTANNNTTTTTAVVVHEKEEEIIEVVATTQKPAKKEKRVRTFLDVARSLKQSSKRFRKRPAQLIFSVRMPMEYDEETGELVVSQSLQDRLLQRRYRDEVQRRKVFRRRGRLQSLPDWCYNANERSEFRLREIVCVAETPLNFSEIFTVEEIPAFRAYDRRVTTTHIRLSRTTAIAHRRKNQWIRRFRIFNCKKPFWHVGAFCDQAAMKEDSRGERRFESNNVNFAHQDDKFKCNRNRGFKRNARRNNGWDNFPRWRMGNSEKQMQGQPWLTTRAKKIYKGKHRLEEFGWTGIG